MVPPLAPFLTILMMIFPFDLHFRSKRVKDNFNKGRGRESVKSRAGRRKRMRNSLTCAQGKKALANLEAMNEQGEKSNG